MTAEPTRLRIGILLDDESISAWALEMLRRICEGSYAEVVVLIMNDNRQARPESLLQRIRRRHSRALYALYSRVERVLFPVSPDAFVTESIRKVLPDTPRIQVRPVQTRFSDSFTPNDIAMIKAYNLDVIVRLGFRILRGSILRAARYGIWSYHHGDNRTNRGGPPGFWEVMLGLPLTGSVLQVLSEDLDGGNVVYRSYARTDPVSVRRNKNSVYWKSLSFLPRKLEQLHRLGGERFMSVVRKENAEPQFYSSRLYGAPRNIELVGLLLKHSWRLAKRRLRQLVFVDQWCLMFGVAAGGGLSTSLWRFKELVPPRDRFWADPFVLFREGKYFLFFEEFPFATGKGHIACMVLDERGNRTEPRVVLERPYHLSYPFLFERGGELYMVPESAQNGTIDAYRCVEFPDKWELATTLMEGVYGVDATFLETEERWWMFVNVRENEGASSCDELLLFFSDDPLSGNWTAHTMNPVVSDARSARPAGRVFMREGRLYRPSQDNEMGCGHAVRINRIDELSPTEYVETCVGKIEPHWARDVTAVHTLSFEGAMTVVDGLKRRLRGLG
jgi:hypothetical protein